MREHGMTKTRIAGYLFLALLVLIWAAIALDTQTLRYRLMVAIDTPQGVRSGSSVIQLDISDGTKSSLALPDARRVTMTVRGEAAFVDLGGGKSVIAILDRVYPAEVSDARGPGQRNLSAASIPTLVTFADIVDPASAKVVAPTAEGFAAAFGPGYAFRRAMVEIVPAGWWPFNLRDGGWPQWLFGEPITRGIEQRLPGLRDIEKWNATLKALPWDPNRLPVGSGSFKRDF
jgi:hypothetical protein